MLKSLSQKGTGSEYRYQTCCCCSHDSAARVKRLGAGDSLDQNCFTADNLAAALQPLLASDKVQLACRTIAERLRRRDGLARTAEAIEKQTADRSGPTSGTDPVPFGT